MKAFLSGLASERFGNGAPEISRGALLRTPEIQALAEARGQSS